MFFFLLERLYTVSEERQWFQAQQSLLYHAQQSVLYQAQQSLLYQVQQSLLYQVQQGLPNWPTNYKNAYSTLHCLNSRPLCLPVENISKNLFTGSGATSDPKDNKSIMGVVTSPTRFFQQKIN